MEPQVFWLYSLASVSLVWGVFGLRTALGVFAANAILAVIIWYAPQENDIAALLFIGYPFYWGLAFFLFGFIEAIPLPSPAIAYRVVLGCLAGIAFVMLANWDMLRHNAALLYATYAAPVEKRPGLVEKELARATYGQVCLDSNATLMRLALDMKDSEVTAVLLDAFSRCYSASATVEEVVKPVLDNGDIERFEFLLNNGLRPSSLVSGSPYRGSVLAYAAGVARNPELVTALARHYPEDCKHVRFLDVLLSDLRKDGNTAMLELLREKGVAFLE